VADILHTNPTDPAVPHVGPTRAPGASAPSPLKGNPVSRWGLRLVAFGYLLFLLILPVGLLVVRTFEDGLGTFWAALTSEAALHALQVTLSVAIIAVIINTIFGVVTSFLLVRHEFPGKSLLDKLVDLPLAVSPVVVGLALILVYGANSPIGEWLYDQGIELMYHQPAMIIATCFVSLPLVVREVAPILEEIGDDQEQAASTLGASAFQTFRRITLPAIRWGLAYGIVLTLARSLGEFGAVAVVSGKIAGETETTTLFVDRAYNNFNQSSAFAGAFLLAGLAVGALLIMNIFRPKDQ
jgi:sulfate transport system permease protein